MKTVVLTDGKYRSSIAAARALGRAGYRVVVTQTKGDAKNAPPVFSSVFASGVRIPGSVMDPEYPERLAEVLRQYEKPVLFPVGAATLAAVAARREYFSDIADFIVPETDVLDKLNDKKTVHDRAESLGIPVPREYDGTPDTFPVIIKPRCGEKLGLKAADRYTVASNADEFEKKFAKMKEYDPAPIVQEKIDGDGRGASLLIGRDGELISAICHRRLREYPASGGPSTCCVTEYDKELIDSAFRLLSSFGFHGIAMVEFKGDRVLEVNPRVWGTFPLTVFAGSRFCENYARAAAGEQVEYVPADYEVGKKMRFFVNDLAASADLIRHGRLKDGFSGFFDVFRVGEALKDKEDRAAYKKYIKSYFKK